ncbi:hypothetical protein MAJ_05372, partial [Metarhizium majus ARSEF 297]
MELNEKDVLKLAKERPEEFVAWTADDFKNQPLKEAVMAAALNARPGASVDALISLLNDIRSDIYQEKLGQVYQRVSFLGRPYVEFQTLSRLCKHLDIEFGGTSEAHCPAMTTGPADIVFSTMYLKAQDAEEAKVVAMLQRAMVEAKARKAAKAAEAAKTAKPSAPGDLAKSRWASNQEASAGPAPKDTAAAPKDSKAPAELSKGKEKARAASEPEDPLGVAWKHIQPDVKLPEWPDSADHELGQFDIPFPAARDWEACFGRCRRDVWRLMHPAVQVGCQVNGKGFRKVVVRLRDGQPVTPFNQLELFRSWCGVASWARQLAKENRDITITDFLGKYLKDSARGMYPLDLQKA